MAKATTNAAARPGATAASVAARAHHPAWHRAHRGFPAAASRRRTPSGSPAPRARTPRLSTGSGSPARRAAARHQGARPAHRGRSIRGPPVRRLPRTASWPRRARPAPPVSPAASWPAQGIPSRSVPCASPPCWTPRRAAPTPWRSPRRWQRPPRQPGSARRPWWRRQLRPPRRRPRRSCRLHPAPRRAASSAVPGLWGLVPCSPCGSRGIWCPPMPTGMAPSNASWPALRPAVTGPAAPAAKRILDTGPTGCPPTRSR